MPGLEDKVEELDHASKEYEKKKLKHTQTYACIEGMCRNHGTPCKDQIFKLYAEEFQVNDINQIFNMIVIENITRLRKVTPT